MAVLKNPLFGNISGRIGDYVFKVINGKTHVYYRPKTEKPKNKEFYDDDNSSIKEPGSFKSKILSFIKTKTKK